jgi:hypothetical protein
MVHKRVPRLIRIRSGTLRLRVEIYTHRCGMSGYSGPV